MECRDYEVLIQRYIDDALSEAEIQALEAHMADCSACAKVCRELMELDALLADTLPDVEVPADFHASVMASLPELYAKPAAIGKARAKASRRWFRGVAAAAAVVALAVGIGFMPQQAETPDIIVADGSDVILQNGADDATSGIIASTVEDSGNAEADPTVQDDAPVAPALPPVVTQPQQPENFTTELDLPAVAINNEAHGDFATILLASYESCDAFLPVVIGDTVTYYIELDGVFYCWQVDVNGTSEPVCIGVHDGIPQGGSSTQLENVDGVLTYKAKSPDAYFTAVNDANGFSIVSSDGNVVSQTVGGGPIISWANDSNKVLFSDPMGNLYISYVAEGLLLPVASEVSSVVWCGNNTIIYAAENPDTGFYSIYRAMMP